LRNRKVLSLEWKNGVVMDDKSGDDDTGGEMTVEKR